MLNKQTHLVKLVYSTNRPPDWTFKGLLVQNALGVVHDHQALAVEGFQQMLRDVPAFTLDVASTISAHREMLLLREVQQVGWNEDAAVGAQKVATTAAATNSGPTDHFVATAHSLGRSSFHSRRKMQTRHERCHERTSMRSKCACIHNTRGCIHKESRSEIPEF